MINLPKGKIKASRSNPKKMILFGNPKIGKTTALSELEDCLLLDLEGGSDFVDAMKIDIIEEAIAENILPIIALRRVVKQIATENKEKGGYVYKIIALDTVTALEDLVLPLAGKMYQNTAIGKNWKGSDVTLLPNGAGYRWTRMALKLIISELEEICDTLIILGHVKDKLVGKAGEEMTERGLSLTGQMPAILCSMVDAVGYMYRDENKTIVNFIAEETMVAGSRSPHLINKKITLIESDEDANLTIDWSEIFID